MLYYRALIAGPGRAAAGRRRACARRSTPRRRSAAGRRCTPSCAKVDPAAAQRIPPNDAQRIQRALEVWQLTGKPLSALQGASARRCRSSSRAFALVPERALLHRQHRSSASTPCCALGLVDELKALRKKLPPDAGDAEHARGGLPAGLGVPRGRDRRERDAGAAAIAATRQLAKRQLTWLRSFPDLVRLDAGGAQDAAVALHLLLDEGRQLLGR